MFNQMYYSVRNRLSLRLIALAIVVLGNVFFLFLAHTNDFMEWQAGLGIVFASFGFLGLFIVNVIATDGAFKNALFKEPASYLMLLTPVPAWKRILGALIPSVIFDTLAFGIGILFIVIMAVGINDGASLGDLIWQPDTWRMDNHVLYVAVFAAVGYAWIILTGVFGHALVKTVLSHMPLRRLMAVIITFLVVCALSWLSIVLLPFGEIYRFGPFFTVMVYQTQVWHYVATILLLALQAVILLVAASRLLDRSV